MSNPSRSRSSVRCIGMFACAIIAVVFGVFSPSSAMAQDVEVMVIPLSDYADGDAAPDGSGFVLLASSAYPNRYGVVITSDSGVSSAEITVGQDGSFATSFQTGNSGYDLDAPIALNRSGGVAYAFAVKASGQQAAQTPGAASSSWLDNYANWFNGTFGSGWSNSVGGVIQSVAPIGANTSDGWILTGTIGVSIPAGAVILVGGEVLLGVGTIGGATVATGGASATAMAALDAQIGRLIIVAQARFAAAAAAEAAGDLATAALLRASASELAQLILVLQRQLPPLP